MSIIEKALGKNQESESEKHRSGHNHGQGSTTDADGIDQAELNKQYLSQQAIPDSLDESEQFSSQNDVTSNAAGNQGINRATENNKKSSQITIDLEQLADQGIIVPSEERSILNEEYRRIKQPLINNIKGKSAHVIDKANLIQITSALPGEGKTFTAINLAMAISQELDYKVLLIDADLLRPSINEVFDIEAKKGLSDYLSGDVDSLADVLQTTNIPKLTLLPAGKQHHLSSELFSSTLMDDLFAELSERYSDRVIIIDSPPVLSTNEANILSRKVGQIVFVIEQNKTTQAAVKEALSQFADDSVIGIVMNKSRTDNSSSYYGYYY